MNLGDFKSLLVGAKDSCVILLETAAGEESAWMVPKLSVVLELSNFWAFGRGLRDIEYADPRCKDGSEAYRILENLDYVNRLVPKIYDTDQESSICKIVMRICNRMDRCRHQKEEGESLKGGLSFNLGNAGILCRGWLELVVLPPVWKR
jgi:hypothetical protein